MSEIKERPILFNVEMVRAILEGRKGMTRRVIKLPAAPDRLGQWKPTTFGGVGVTDAQGKPTEERVAIWHTRTGDTIGCPYGVPGDRLWVRETWRCERYENIDGGEGYREETLVYKADDGGESGIWSPSIHMPRWACRILLEITDVRVERVQDITEEDVKAEGIIYRKPYYHSTIHPVKGTYQCWPTAKVAFEKLWDSINHKRGFGWNVNPWVWVVSFKRVEG